jgi:hypothetical protein
MASNTDSVYRTAEIVIGFSLQHQALRKELSDIQFSTIYKAIQEEKVVPLPYLIIGSYLLSLPIKGPPRYLFGSDKILL